MPKRFEVFGAYPVDRYEVSESHWQKQAWEDVDTEVGHELSQAIGVYVFSLRNGKNYKPIYVGLTTKQAFRKEVFNKANLHMISKLNGKKNHSKGTLFLHLLAKRKEKQSGFAKPNREWLHSLEVLMIFICRRKNPSLLNKKHTTWLDGIGIDGITANQKLLGKPAEAIRTLKIAMDW